MSECACVYACEERGGVEKTKQIKTLSQGIMKAMKIYIYKSLSSNSTIVHKKETT